MIFKTLCILFFLIAPAKYVFAEQAGDLVFIVNSENPATKLDLNDLKSFYYKKKRQWPDGTSVRFIDRAATAGIRENFLKNFLKKSNSDVELFWIGQKLYTGDSAPLKEASDEMTLQFISNFKGAIGYVAAGTPLSVKNVKTIKIELNQED